MNASSINSSPIRELLTPLVGLPTSTCAAADIQNIRYILVALEAALVCDILSSLSEEYRMLKQKFGLFGGLYILSSLTAPITLKSRPLGPTGLCADSRLETSVGAASVVVAAFDTLVFTSITAKLLSLNRFKGHTSAWKMFFTGKGLGHISRLVMQTGQFYYLITVGATIASSVAILCPSVPTPYADATIPVTGFLTNAMATRVYRQLKLGVFQGGATTFPEGMTSLKFRDTKTNETDTSCLRCHSRSPEGPKSPDDLEIGRYQHLPVHPSYNTVRDSEFIMFFVDRKDP
ncbi:hypothetical protein EIP91_005857 [Steccherinum ochraceum]|uniref:Uncharacterized protein n=1 Tax=Steccherinum ochraceum TaxID=92696 RepID=A0A4R0R6K2_9APHY|nr:hypothetical protein EIP91_005857 [Steccherinum ochraceum]